MKMQDTVIKVENPTGNDIQAIFEDGRTANLPSQGCLRDPKGIHLSNLDEMKKQGAKVTFDLTEVR